MNRRTPEPDREALLQRVGAIARETWSDDVSPAADATGRARLEAALVFGKTRRSGLARLALAAVVAGAVALALAFFWSPPLGYVVAGSSSSVGGYLQPGDAAPATARFTDGTLVRVAPGGRARVVETDRHGARVALEQGRAMLDVVHRPGAHWSVEAGPYTIAVTGTEFDAEWSGPDERLVVELRRGAVVVSGPMAVSGIGLAAGQRLVASVRDGQLHIEPLTRKESTSGVAARVGARAGLAAGASPDVAEATTPEATPTTPEPSAPGTAPDEPTRVPQENPLPPPSSAPSSAPGPAPEMSWEKRVREGDFTGVVHDAEALGLDATLTTGSRGDLTALADAARYTGNTTVADRALVAVMRRFPGSPDARAAPFLRGRIAEKRGAGSEAIALYDRYLSESPRGPFVAEALGRKMLAVEARDGAGAARTIARDYLVRFPRGPYADPARRLVDSE